MPFIIASASISSSCTPRSRCDALRSGCFSSDDISRSLPFASMCMYSGCAAAGSTSKSTRTSPRFVMRRSVMREPRSSTGAGSLP